VCRIDVEPGSAAFTALGARVISPDRPGVGGSDRAPGRTTYDFADDARELLDALGIERCAVMGWSFGGQYAAAVAARLPERVHRLAIIAGCLPLDDAATLHDLNATDRRLTWLSRHAPVVARAGIGAMSRYARRMPRRVASSQARRSPVPDAAALHESGDWFGRALAEGTGHALGVVDEYRAATAPWGFGLAQVEAPAHVYQGCADPMVPPAWAPRIAGALADARLTTYEGEGHMIALSHRGDVVRDLVA
jgi:pimeloyl-ACP methyl ester carboxylesterase